MAAEDSTVAAGACGDAVDLLWKRGNPDGAIRLEASGPGSPLTRRSLLWPSLYDRRSVTASRMRSGTKHQCFWIQFEIRSRTLGENCMSAHHFPGLDGCVHTAYGIVDGTAVAERPQSISTDGRRQPLLDVGGRPIPGVPPCAVVFGSRPDPQTLEIGAEVEGTTLSAATFKVSADRKTLTATNQGVGPKGPYKSVWIFERVVQ